VRATGRLVATPAGDDVGALLVVRGDAVPLARAGPVHRITADLRDGLRQAVRGLPPDSRGLLPGLVLGDTSALPGDLEEAMRVAGLTHLTAVSGANARRTLLLCRYASGHLCAGEPRRPRQRPLSAGTGG
jgi:competence protein ComEC